MFPGLFSSDKQWSKIGSLSGSVPSPQMQYVPFLLDSATQPEAPSPIIVALEAMEWGVFRKQAWQICVWVCICVCVCVPVHSQWGGWESEHITSLKIDQYNYVVLVFKYMLEAL